MHVGAAEMKGSPLVMGGLVYPLGPWSAFCRAADKPYIEIDVDDDGTAELKCGDIEAVIGVVEWDGTRPTAGPYMFWTVERAPLFRLITAVEMAGLQTATLVLWLYDTGTVRIDVQISEKPFVELGVALSACGRSEEGK